MYLVISVVFMATIFKLWRNKLAKIVEPINYRINEILLYIKIFTEDTRALINMLRTSQGLLPPPTPLVKDQRVDIIIRHFSDIENTVARSKFDSLQAKHPRLFATLMKRAFSAMNDHCKMVEATRVQLAINAKASRRTLCEIRKSIYLSSKDLPPSTTEVICECHDYFKVPCALHPNRLNWKISFSGFIGGKYKTETRLISVGRFPKESYLNKLRADLMIQYKKKSWKWGEGIYHGPYPPIYYFKLFGGDTPVSVHKDEYHWDKLTDLTKELVSSTTSDPKDLRICSCDPTDLQTNCLVHQSETTPIPTTSTKPVEPGYPADSTGMDLEPTEAAKAPSLNFPEEFPMEIQPSDLDYWVPLEGGKPNL